MTWFVTQRIGRLVWRILAARFPELSKVPLEDILAVVEEVLTSTLTLQDAMVKTEPARQGLTSVGSADPARLHYRLVLPGRGK